MEFKSTFIKSVQQTPTIHSFRFSLPEKLDFIPGQYLRVLFDPQDRKNIKLNKFLSFSCAPRLDYIEVTKRLTGSDFSNQLSCLIAGDSVLLQAPLGKCIFQEDFKKMGFLIGGIGITPVMSILGYIQMNNLNTDACLLYANRQQDEIAFRDIIDGYTQNCQNVKAVYTVNYEKPLDPVINFGRIDKDFLVQHMPDIKERVVFIYGPQVMVKAMQELCLALGCLKANLKTEIFVGY